MTARFLMADDVLIKSKRNRAAWNTSTEPLTYQFAKPKKAKPAKAKPPRCPTEHEEQCAVIKWCNTQLHARYIFAIPNGAHKSMASAAKFKREGLRKGFPDLMLPIASGDFHGLFIEMKRTKGGVTSADQRVWIDFLHQAGYAAVVCRGAAEAIKAIEDYLK